MAQLELAQRDPTQILKAGAALKMLSLPAGSLERLHDLKQRAIGLNRDSVLPDEMPELVVRDLTDQEIADMRAAQEADDFGDEIVADEDNVEPVDREADEIIVEIGEDNGRGTKAPIAAAADTRGFRLVREASA
jgi:hypothetical protein